MTFTFTAEELNTRNNRAEAMRKKIKKRIASALLQERIDRKRTLEEISFAIKVLPKKLEALELGRKKINRVIIDALLRYYKKSLKISLVDIPQQQDETN